MKTFIFILVMSFNLFAQTELEKLVATEKEFARTAAEKNTRAAFLEFLADDGIIFAPQAVNGKESWRSRPESKALLAWTPEFADISANGVLGYTTGPWELYPQGKENPPTAFGHYVTIWQKRPDGNFKAVLDIGSRHQQTPLAQNWTSPAGSGKELNEKKISAADSSAQFFETAERISVEKAYKMFLAEDARLYRDGKMPLVGKKNSLNELKNTRNGKIRFAKRSIFTSAADLAYISNSYTTYDRDGRESEKGNFLQIWKLRRGKWEIVLDLFNPLPKI